jgi:hypothetical protein
MEQNFNFWKLRRNWQEAAKLEKNELRECKLIAIAIAFSYVTCHKGAVEVPKMRWISLEIGRRFTFGYGL